MVILSLCGRYGYYLLYSTVRHECYYTVRYKISLRPTLVLLYSMVRHECNYGVRSVGVQHEYYYKVRYILYLRPT